MAVWREASQGVPDLTDFMNDWFYGSMIKDRGYNISGVKKKKSPVGVDGDGEDADEISRGKNIKNTRRMTEEWLEQAKMLVESNPSSRRSSVSTSNTGGSPRLAAAAAAPASEGRQSDNTIKLLSRQVSRHRASSVKVGDDILRRNSYQSDSLDSDSARSSAARKSILDYSPSSAPIASESFSDSDGGGATSHRLPPRQNIQRKSRFQNPAERSCPPPRPPPQSQRTRYPMAPLPSDGEIHRSAPMLSPPRNLVESPQRRSIASSTCSLGKIEGGAAAAASRRSSVSVRSEVNLPKRRFTVPSNDDGWRPEEQGVDEDVRQINAFLRRQRSMILGLSSGDGVAKAKMLLSGSSTTCMASSMVATICYAWMLENRKKRDDGMLTVPVINIPREKMWKHKQAAWLFHHVGIDASALLFSNEVDLEGLIMARQLSILVVGQDILRTSSEVGSQCTLLTDNYCEDAYNLLQSPNLKKLLLAGILLDTENLKDITRFSTNRDAEAVQLLLVGSAPNFRKGFYGQLMQDHMALPFREVMVHNYGNSSTEDNMKNEGSRESRVSARKSVSNVLQEIKVRHSVSQKKQQQAAAPVATAVVAPEARAPLPATEPTRAKNKSVLVKWFSFGWK